jgi:hypothetical protein
MWGFTDGHSRVPSRFKHSANGAMKNAAVERRGSCVYFFRRSSSVPSRGGSLSLPHPLSPDGVFLRVDPIPSGSLRTKSVLNLPLVWLSGAWPRAECAAVDSTLTFIAKASTYFLEPLRIETRLTRRVGGEPLCRGSGIGMVGLDAGGALVLRLRITHLMLRFVELSEGVVGLGEIRIDPGRRLE